MPRSADTAPYQRIKQTLKAELQAGHWRPGALMPSEAELVERFSVSRMTVNRALRELQAEGLVERVQGAGTYAADQEQRLRMSSQLTIRDLHREIEARGHQHQAQVQFARQEPAPADIAARLGLAEGDPVFHLLLVHLDNGVPLQCEDRYVNPVHAPELLSTDFTTITPTQYLIERVPQWEAQFMVEAAYPTAREARLLGIRSKEPCLIITRRTVTRGIPVTTARLVHPGSRYQLEEAYQP